MKRVILWTLAAAAALWVLSLIPFTKEIDRTIPARIYEDGAVIGETALSLKGEKTRYLFGRENSYNGTFAIGCYERSCRDGALASVTWEKEMNYQRLHWFYKGDLPLWDTVSSILINEDMDAFALMFTDGRVIASRDEMYELFSAHISYDPDREVTSLTGPVPDF